MSGRFEFRATGLAGLWTAVHKDLADERGTFARWYCAEEFARAGVDRPIAQINHSRTASKGATRGLHFQLPPHAETKIVRCVRGEVFDVAVDLRRGSDTFLRWHGQRLSPGARNALVIPEGFAHGFQALTDDCELVYLHTRAHAPEAERGLSVLDARLAIQWPLPVTGLSERDGAAAPLAADFQGLLL